MPPNRRHHVPELAALLSVLSLGLVFAAAGGAIPASVLPRASAGVLHAIPHVNAAISLIAMSVISLGWYSIRRGEVRRHRLAMLSGFLLFATFLGLYLYKVILVGPAGFPASAPDVVYTFLYLPVLAIHMLLATLCIPLLYYVLLLGATHPVREIPRTNHPRWGRATVVLWLASFALGIVVYALLYVVPY